MAIKRSFLVRKGFTLHLGDRPPIPGGTIVELTAVEFERHAHQLEPVPRQPVEPTPEPVAEPTPESQDEAKPKKRKSTRKPANEDE